jgi:hypothetical protein
MPQAGLDVTEDVQICKSGSETRASKMLLGPLQVESRNIVHSRVARVTVVLSINNFIYQSEEHFSGAASITAESLISVYR